MIRSDFHIHTNYCDGLNSPEEMVLSAIEKGILVLGFSAHSYTFFDESYCIKKERITDYIAEIKALSKNYASKIRILCGTEMDYYSDMPLDGFDYSIGSVHYIKKNGEYIPVDESPEILLDAKKRLFGGDIYALCEEYFDTVSDVINKTNADIIGHFDLISKFNENGELFDENNPRYVSAYKKAIDKLILNDVPFEVNTGAISRGYKTAPYPSLDMLRYIKKQGGKVILSSDSHSSDGLCFEFDKWENLIREIGFEI